MQKRMVASIMIWVLIICAMPLCNAFGVQAMTQEELDELHAKVDKVFKNYKTIGGAVVIMKGEELVYERYYGLSRKSGKVPVTAETYFRTASITKMITGIGALMLVEWGEFGLDDDLNDFLGLNVRNRKFPNAPVTLRMLMTHTSGLSDTVSFRNENNTLEDIFRINKTRTNFGTKAPGKAFSYANFGAGIVGAMLEKATAMSINTAMKTFVFEPLGLDAAYHPTLLKNPDNIINQHERDGSVARAATKVLKEAFDDTSDYNLHYREGIGNVWINARDMGKLLAMLCGGGVYQGVRILKEETVAEMIADQVGRNGIEAKTPYALFCERFTTLAEGKVIYGHQGQSLGMVTEAFFDPETGFSMVLFTNGASRAIENRICKIGRNMFSALYPVFSQ